MSWNPLYRSEYYDPHLAYLQITEHGVKIVLNEYFYNSKEQYQRTKIFYENCTLNKYNNLDAALLRAKEIRNEVAPDMLGKRFMEFGPRPKTSNVNNTTGIIGVSHNEEKSCYYATWSEKLFHGNLRERKSKYFGYGPRSPYTQKQAFKLAKELRLLMIETHYTPIDELRQIVINDLSEARAKKKNKKIIIPKYLEIEQERKIRKKTVKKKVA